MTSMWANYLMKSMGELITSTDYYIVERKALSSTIYIVLFLGALFQFTIEKKIVYQSF